MGSSLYFGRRTHLKFKIDENFSFLSLISVDTRIFTITALDTLIIALICTDWHCFHIDWTRKMHLGDFLIAERAVLAAYARTARTRLVGFQIFEKRDFRVVTTTRRKMFFGYNFGKRRWKNPKFLHFVCNFAQLLALKKLGCNDRFWAAHAKNSKKFPSTCFLAGVLSLFIYWK